ncbi:MAG: ribosomal protein S18-alanine N-acetyltransferase [Nitrospirae bacterium]|nr:ribosomal protein S18-alanine N-acetyltransferase [Nitrospirota bacterium]
MWTLSQAEEKDLEEIVAIEHDSFSDPWTPGMFRGELTNPYSSLWVARDGEGGMGGFVCFWVVGDEIHFLDLAVAPPFRRKGLGEFLIRESLEWGGERGAGTAFLEVRESNQGARGLYRKMGFEEMMRRKGYYRNPREDALVMMKRL